MPTAEGTVTVSIYNTAVTLKTEIDTYNTSVNASSASDYTYYGNLQIVFDNYEAEIIEVLAGYEDTLEDWDINSDNVQYEDKATVATMTSLLEALENKGVDLEASLSADAYSKYTTAVAAVAEMQKAIDAQYDANKELEDEWTLLDPEAEVNKYDAATTASDDLASKYGLSDEQAEELLATDSITTAEGYQTYVEDTIANFVLNYAVLLYNSGATSADVDEMNEILAELKTGVFNLEADQLKTLLNNEVEVQAEDLGLDLDEIEDFDLYAAFNTAYEKYNTSSSSSSSDTDYTGGSIYQDGVTGYWNADGVFVWYGYWEDGVFIYTVDLNTVYVSPESGVVTSTSTSGATSPTTGDPETGDETVATTTPSTTTTEEPTVADTAADDVTVEDVLTDSTTVASLATTDSSVGSILLVVAALAVVCGVALVVLYKRKEAEAEED